MYGRLRAKVLPALIPPNTKVLVAISGGPDSVALSHILWRYAREKETGVSLVLTHVNHMVRPEAEQEEKLVLDLAGEWGIPCFVHRFDSKRYAKDSGRSFQEAAREWRYGIWKEDMAKADCRLLATAHHLGDQAETVLYRLLRGAGAAGLAGIYPYKERIIRPLLSVTKEEILEYCRLERLPYALDSSNREPVYDRNRIRLDLLPKLAADYNPGIWQALGRTAELLRWDEEYLGMVADQEWHKYCLRETGEEIGLSREIYALPPALLSRLLRKAAALISGEPRGLGFSYVEALMESKGVSGWRQNLPGILARIDEEGLWLSKNNGTETVQPVGNPVGLLRVVVPYEAWAEIPETDLKVGLFHQLPGTLNTETDGVLITELADEGIRNRAEALVMRTRRPGDKMWFKGMGHKSIKKVFQEEGLTGRKRETQLVLAAGSEVLWLPGRKRSGLFAPVPEGDKLYCILMRI